MAESIELEIRIASAGGLRHRATVARGPSQEGGSGYFDLPADGGLTAGAGEWRDLRRKAEMSDTALFRLLTDHGRALFELVFVGEIFAAFLRSYELARSEGRWFRLQFSFENAPAAMDQPWEALVFPREGNALALLPEVSIERRLITAQAMEVPRPPEDGRLSALVAGASPRNLETLDVKAERKLIKTILGKQVEMRLLEHTSLGSLGKALAAKEAGFDLIHLIGHGDFEGEEGGLWLEDERGGGIRLTGRELPATFRRPVSFVFLNICHGGRSSPNPFAGIAEALLRSGVRAVVAMRREISDPGAVELAKNFYKCLARGESLTRALAKARGNVVNAHYGDWAVPMLYLAGDDFALLPPAPPPPIGKELGPNLDGEETAEMAAETAFSPPRRFFGAPGEDGPSLARRAVAAALLLVMVVFGMWYVWPSPESQADPTGDEPKATKPAPSEPPAAEPPAIEPSASKTEPPASLESTSSAPAPSSQTKEAPKSEPPPAPKEPAPKPLPPDENARRCPSPKGIPIEFIYVPAGKTFLQGEDRGDDDFGPRHEVTLTRDYCLAKNETTRALWNLVKGAPAPSAEDARLPRTYVTKEDVLEFLQLLNRLEPAGKYRLPTESEWEYAARAGTSTVYSFGDDEKLLSKYGNCLNDDRPQKPMPVGSLKANPWGFNDMHGNVWEWVEDDWTAYSPAPASDPVGRNPRANPTRRGGAYDASAENCWSAARKDLGLGKKKTVGFRIARTPVR